MSDQQLWCAVIQQAIIDATEPLSTKHPWRRREQLDSRDWLTKPNKDFHIVCALAGMEPIRVREYATRVIADASKNDQPLIRRVRKPRTNRNTDASPHNHP